jgi:hypothetical protein
MARVYVHCSCGGLMRCNRDSKPMGRSAIGATISPVRAPCVCGGAAVTLASVVVVMRSCWVTSGVSSRAGAAMGPSRAPLRPVMTARCSQRCFRSPLRGTGRADGLYTVGAVPLLTMPNPWGNATPAWACTACMIVGDTIQVFLKLVYPCVVHHGLRETPP